MKIDELTGTRMNTLFGYLADRTVDSPDGPHATAMREFTGRQELDEHDVALVRAIAGGQVALYGALLDQRRERARVNTILTGLCLDSPEQATLIPQIDVLLPDPTRDPRYASTAAAADLLALLPEQAASASPEA
jgi:hypothetical protein